MIREGLMQTGNFTVELVDDAPLALRRLAGQLGSLICVSKTRFADENLTVSGMLGSNNLAYTGVMTRKANQMRTLSGFGLGWYLQSGKGHCGQPLATPPTFPATFSSILTTWLPGTGVSNGINKGTGYSASTTAIAALDAYTYLPPTKPLIDSLAGATGNEYRITTQGYMDYGVSTSLFRSTPNVVIAPGLAGREYGYRVLNVDRFSMSTDVDNFRNWAWMCRSDDRTMQSNVVASGPDALTLKRMGGSSGVVYQIQAMKAVNSTDNTDLLNLVTAAADYYAAPNYEINCSVKEYCPPTFLIPGDWVYVYSPDDDFYDTANPIVVQGQTIHPKKVRVAGYQWPVEAGMGVYALYNDVVTELTDYVKWETGRATSLEFDLRPKSLRAAADESLIG